MKEITVSNSYNNIFLDVFLNPCVGKTLFIYKSDAIDPKFPNIINASFKKIKFKDIPVVIRGKIPFWMKLFNKKYFIDKELIKNPELIEGE